MSTVQQKACEFIESLMKKYLVDHDYEAMKTVLHQDISCIGSGIDELWNGFDDACTKLEILSRFDNIDFEIVDAWYEAQELSNTDFVVYGEVQLEKKLQNGENYYSRFRLTAVCRYIDNSFIIMHMHFSLPIVSSHTSENKKASSIREHRSQLADKLQDLIDLTNGIKGGVEICQVDKGYTIQYLSNGFTELLDYTEEELHNLIGSPHRTLIFESDEDYNKIVDHINKQLETSDSYSVEYRMLQKGGHYIWVLENGRFIEENGENKLHCLIVDIHKQKIQEQELALSKQRYELAILATKVQMFEFNIETQEIHLFTGDAQLYGIPKVLKNAGIDLIENGLISEASIEPFTDIFKSVTNGATSAECDIAVKLIDENYTNFHLSMTTGFSDEGIPIFAIGVITNIQELVDLQQESKLSKTVIEKRSLGTFEINVSRDVVTTNSTYQDVMKTASPSFCYSELLEKFIETRIYEEDKEIYFEVMNIDKLRSITDYEGTNISVQYRRNVEGSTGYRWWSASGRLYIDNRTDEVKAFFYEEDINDQKEQELTLRYDAEHDKMTGYLDKIAFERYVKEFLTSAKNVNEDHALFVLDLDYFKNINDTFGHVFGDGVLIEASKIIKSEFRSTDIIGRIGGDECSILMKNIASIEEVRQKAEVICQKLRKTYTVDNKSVTISSSIGISLASVNKFDYDALFSEADESLYTSKNLGRNRYTLNYPK